MEARILDGDSVFVLTRVIDNLRVTDHDAAVLLQAVLDESLPIAGNPTTLEVMRLANLMATARVRRYAKSVGNAPLESNAQIERRINRSFESLAVEVERLDEAKKKAERELDIARDENLRLRLLIEALAWEPRPRTMSHT